MIGRNREKAVADCDVVVTTTTAREPIVQKQWVREEGVLFASLGSDPELEEGITLAADKIVADNWVQNEHRGEFKKLIAEGKMTKEDLHAELPTIVAGRAPGREAPEEMIVASLTGLGAIDIAIAAEIYTRARDQGIGQKVQLQ